MPDNENSNVDLTDSGQYIKYRPMELQEKENSYCRSKTPAVSNVTMELKKSKQEIKDDKEHPSDVDDAQNTDLQRSYTMKLTSLNETRDEIATKTTPIPTTPSTNILMNAPSLHLYKPIDEKKSKSKEEINEDVEKTVTEPEPDVEESSLWSEEGETSGMPRTESHASRVGRAVRQFLCCGINIEAASEDNISYMRDSGL